MTKDPVLEFLNTVTPRVGPANAVGLLKDAHFSAFKQLFVEAGLKSERVDEVVHLHLTQTAQNILKNVPVPSPIQVKL